MSHLKIINYKTYWDCDNHFGKIELFFDDGTKLELPDQLAASEFSAILSILQFSGVLWHIQSRSIVKG